jgi:hypothetical protein
LSEVRPWSKLGHLEEAAPLGLVPQTILERTMRVLLSYEELYRFRVMKLGERIEAHRIEPHSATAANKRYKVSAVSRSRKRRARRSGPSRDQT